MQLVTKWSLDDPLTLDTRSHGLESCYQVLHLSNPVYPNTFYGVKYPVVGLQCSKTTAYRTCVGLALTTSFSSWIPCILYILNVKIPILLMYMNTHHCVTLIHPKVPSHRPSYLVSVGYVTGREVGRTPTANRVPDLHATRDDQRKYGQHEDGVTTVHAITETVSVARPRVAAI